MKITELLKEAEPMAPGEQPTMGTEPPAQGQGNAPAPAAPDLGKQQQQQARNAQQQRAMLQQQIKSAEEQIKAQQEQVTAMKKQLAAI